MNKKRFQALERELERLKQERDARTAQETLRQVYAKGYSDAGASYRKRSLKGFNAESGAPSEDIDFNNATLRQRARMLYMAAPVATGAVNTNRTKVIGSGLRMRCAVNNDVLGLSDEEARRWQKQTEAEWELWCEKKTCDALELNNFYELQQIALKAWLMSGDCFVVFKRYDADANNPYTLRLQLIEADRVSTPQDGDRFLIAPYATEGVNKKNGNKIYDGVEVDGDGRVVAYHVCSVYPGQITDAKAEWTRVETVGEKSGLPNILHLFEAERPDQHRGVPFLAPVIEVILQQRRYTESELTAALVQTYFTAWITTATDPSQFPLNEIGLGDIDGGENGFDTGAVNSGGVSDSPDEYEMGPGQVAHLQDGENITFGNPNIPTAGFEAFCKSIVKMVGSALELPYDVLIKEFNSSYSAAKGALEEAWEVFKMRRAAFVNDFCRPVYETWLAEAVATGRIKAPGFFTDPRVRAAWSGARWDGPAQTHLDPVKEATAAEIEVRNAWKTNEQVTREYYGGDWHDNVAALAEEEELIGPIRNKIGERSSESGDDRGEGHVIGSDE